MVVASARRRKSLDSSPTLNDTHSDAGAKWLVGIGAGRETLKVVGYSVYLGTTLAVDGTS